jgi:hypothetical protein
MTDKQKETLLFILKAASQVIGIIIFLAGVGTHSKK